jgi:hypothetical protein
MENSGIEAAYRQHGNEAAGSAAFLCGACQIPLLPADAPQSLPAGLCGTCQAALAMGDAGKARQILQTMDAPMLLMQPEPRLVFTANDRALALFGRTLDEAEAHRGGEMFGCIHSYSTDGCGKDANCDDCRIKAAIVSGFTGTASAETTLTIRGSGGDLPYTLAVSAEKAGSYALVRIDRFEPKNGGPNE